MTPAQREDLLQTRAWLRHCDAAVAEHFHVQPSEFSRLTPRVTREMYLAARDDKGALIPPREKEKAPQSLDDELAALNELYMAFGGPRGGALEGGIEQYQSLREMLRQKWEGGGCGGQ